MRIKTADIYGWPGYEAACGDVRLGLVPSLGGRIMSLKFRGEELFYVPSEGRGVLPDIPVGEITDLAAFKRAFGFRIFGGDKTWIAPENEWLERSPPVDLDAGVYVFEERGDAVVMTSPVCRETGLQIVRRIGLLDSGDMVLMEILRNRSAHALRKGIWDVTQITRPFSAYIPAELKDVRSYYLEDPTLPDPGFSPVMKNGWSVIPCENDVCFKFGAMVREGGAAVFKQAQQGLVVFARIFNVEAGKPYAHRSMVEVFNSSRHPYGELEVHGPLSEILPGAEVSMTQLWRVYAA